MFDRMPGRPLRSLASLVLLSGKISDFPSPGGGNSSYTTTIPCPQISCSQRIIENMDETGISGTHAQGGGFSINHFSVSWSPVFSFPDSLSPEEAILKVESIESIKFAKVPDRKDFDDVDVWETLVNKTVLECHPTITQLVLNLSYVEGIRHVAYVKENVQIFKPNLGSSLIYRTRKNQTRIGNPTYDTWAAEVKKIAQMWNIWAILDAALLAFEFKCEGLTYYITDYTIPEIYFDKYCQEKGRPQTVTFR
jgi:hypothetical protein